MPQKLRQAKYLYCEWLILPDSRQALAFDDATWAAYSTIAARHDQTPEQFIMGQIGFGIARPARRPRRSQKRAADIIDLAAHRKNDP